MKVIGVSGFGPVSQDSQMGEKLYLDDLGSRSKRSMATTGSPSGSLGRGTSR